MHLDLDIIYVCNVIKTHSKVEAYDVHSKHQLSGSGSNSLNLWKLPGRFSYGLEMRLVMNQQHACGCIAT